MTDFVTWYGLVATAVFGLVAYLFYRNHRKAMLLDKDKKTIQMECHRSLHFSIERPSINEEKIKKESEQNPLSSHQIKIKCPECGSDESTSSGKYYSSKSGINLKRRCKNCGKYYRYSPTNQKVLQPAGDRFKDRCKHFNDLPQQFTIDEYQDFFSKLGLPITLNIAYRDIRRLINLNKLTHPSVGVWKKVEVVQEKTELLSKPLSEIDKSNTIGNVCPRCGSGEFRGVTVLYTSTGKYLKVTCKKCGNGYNQPYLDQKDRLKHFKDIPSTFTANAYKDFFSKLGFGIGVSAVKNDIHVLIGLKKIQETGIGGVYKKVELIEERGMVANEVLTQRKLTESVFRERTPF